VFSTPGDFDLTLNSAIYRQLQTIVFSTGFPTSKTKMVGFVEVGMLLLIGIVDDFSNQVCCELCIVGTRLRTQSLGRFLV